MAAKETREVVIALRAVVPPIIAALKDGFQVSDVTQLIKDLGLNPDVRAKVEAAVANARAIPDEFKNVTGDQLVALVAELAPDTVGLITDTIEALKKPAAQ